jgi:glycosyltransferase involved in cell wall biosynthesis
VSERTTQRLALCIPARNAARYIPRLFESARSQTSPFDEILVFDDASDDPTAEIAQKHGAIVVRSDRNVGPSAGKNTLACRAQAEWLHFHDADDWLGSDFVARARTAISRNDTDVVLFATEDRADGSDALLGRRQWDDDALRADPVRYCIVNTVTNCGVYRKSRFLAAGGFETSAAAKYNEDQAMHLNLALNGLRFRSDPYFGVIVAQRSGSMSSGHRVECARAHFEVLAHVAGVTGTKYAPEIGARLWRIAGVLGGYRDWRYARKCVALARELGYTDPHTEDSMFRFAARVSPFGAVVAREAFIRTFKPALRRNYPVAP